jgi:hypothetical protein
MIATSMRLRAPSFYMTFLPVVAIYSRRLNKKLFLCQSGDAACSGSLGADILSAPLKGFKKIPFPNTIKSIFVFKEGLNHGSWFRLKNAVLTDARNIRSVQDGPGSTFLSDPLS